jgi:hypothetical protein
VWNNASPLQSLFYKEEEAEQSSKTKKEKVEGSNLKKKHYAILDPGECAIYFCKHFLPVDTVRAPFCQCFFHDEKIQEKEDRMYNEF